MSVKDDALHVDFSPANAQGMEERKIAACHVDVKKFSIGNYDRFGQTASLAMQSASPWQERINACSVKQPAW
jgi:hypothetical protein